MPKAKADEAKQVGAEILEARRVQLIQKLQDAADKATRTKEQYDEIAERLKELMEANAPESVLEKIRERQKKRGEENQAAYDEYTRIQARIEEVQELIAILKGEE